MLYIANNITIITCSLVSSYGEQNNVMAMSRVSVNILPLDGSLDEGALGRPSLPAVLVSLSVILLHTHTRASLKGGP